MSVLKVSDFLSEFSIFSLFILKISNLFAILCSTFKCCVYNKKSYCQDIIFFNKSRTLEEHQNVKCICKLKININIYCNEF